MLTNRIYADHAFLVKLQLAEEGRYSGEVSFYINDPMMLDAVLSEIRNTQTIDWDKFLIHRDDFNYEKIEFGLQTVQNLVVILLVCVSIVSFAILILVLALRIRRRVHEAGIFLSIGMPKREIVIQFLAEVFVITIIAFVCSYFAAGFAAETAGRSIFSDGYTTQVTEQVLETGIQTTVVHNTALGTSLVNTILIYAVQLIVIAMAALLSSLAVIRLKPREILSKMS